MAEGQCDFLSPEAANSSVFTWAYNISRLLGDYRYSNSGGVTVVDHKVLLLRLLASGLPMAGVPGPRSTSRCARRRHRPHCLASSRRPDPSQDRGPPPQAQGGQSLKAAGEAAEALAEA